MRLYSLSWKNIWRNKVRSGVIIGAIAIGLFAGTYMCAFLLGWEMGSLNNDVASHISHIQIHKPEFIADKSIREVFSKAEIETTLLSSGIEAKVAYRLKISGMLASAANAVGVEASGVFPDEERAVSDIYAHIDDSLGSYLPPEAKMPIVISKKTAEKLKVHLKSKIVFTFSDAEGDIQSLAFRVSGIYSTTNSMYDENSVYMRYSDLIGSAGLAEGSIHEVAMIFHDLEACDIFYPQVKVLFPDLRVDDWRIISPTHSLSLAWMDLISFLIVGIFLFALSFGIVNTMLMAVLERSREIRMLNAIGMSKNRIFSMIMLETLMLTAVGSLSGILIAALVILPTLESGIDLTPLMGTGFEDWGYGSTIYPIMNLKMFAEIILLVVVTGILSAIYPALKALKINH